MHAKFLEKDFVKDSQPRSKVIPEEMSKDIISLIVLETQNAPMIVEEESTVQQ